jgi:MoaA/NifB/PqqE/SkfB family radical SAM enzyme
LNCAHCYRDIQTINYISLEQIKTICDSIPVDAMGMGTGENILNPEFIEIASYLNKIGVKLSIASNGHTLTKAPGHILEMFSDVELSIDFPTEEEQDSFRGPGNWVLVHKAIERCQNLGIQVSILSTLMCTNFHKMDQMVTLARLNDCNLRVNVYQAVKTDFFRLSYDQFWEGYQRLFSTGMVVSCSEPVVRAAMGFEDVRSPCGRQSIRINPRGQIIPCVYWPVLDKDRFGIEDLSVLGKQAFDESHFLDARSDPPVGTGCACRGGCASRRALNGELNAHDEYCPWVKGDSINLAWKPAPAKDLMRSGNVCTTVVV